MDILVAIFMGALGGALISLFMCGASMASREQEAYMEGFIAGQKDKEVKK